MAVNRHSPSIFRQTPRYFPIREIWLTAELVKRTNNPTRCWIADGRTVPYILEIYKAVAGGERELRERPQIEAFIELISPLQMPATGMEILLEFTRLGLPVSYGPMVMAGATGPVTLAGTLAQENAESLAAIVITQVLCPGTPVMYGGIPHIMDLHTAAISFASPEQGLMAIAMTQIAKSYGLPTGCRKSSTRISQSRWTRPWRARSMVSWSRPGDTCYRPKG